MRGSSGRTLACQTQDPEFKNLQIHKQTNKETNCEITTHFMSFFLATTLLGYSNKVSGKEAQIEKILLLPRNECVIGYLLV
jgi:hypothetical protein